MVDKKNQYRKSSPLGFVAISVNQEGEVTSEMIEMCDSNEQRVAMAERLEELANECRNGAAGCSCKPKRLHRICR